ncbi:GNAT family protein [Tabrizicola sp.]|uniref:GNAT family N-acetyltransferase n=1 Tax=Tabrizicola sp. TaxID=2005166 RepID=UPI00286BEA6D|nr:GNAT family protein [Tabrizicola sp.]
MAEVADQDTTRRAMILTGERVGLSVMQTQDVPTIALWNQNLDFTARLGVPGEAHTLEARQDFYERNSRITDSSAEFSIIALDTGQLVGFGGLFDITRAMTATMFVGIGDRDQRKKGFGTEASRLICEYGFFFRSLHSIKVEVHEYNAEARRLYERLGFKIVGRLRGANLLNNRRYDEVIMDLLHSDLELKHVGRFQSLENNDG